MWPEIWRGQRAPWRPPRGEQHLCGRTSSALHPEWTFLRTSTQSDDAGRRSALPACNPWHKHLLCGEAITTVKPTGKSMPDLTTQDISTSVTTYSRQQTGSRQLTRPGREATSQPRTKGSPSLGHRARVVAPARVLWTRHFHHGPESAAKDRRTWDPRDHRPPSWAKRGELMQRRQVRGGRWQLILDRRPCRSIQTTHG
jgi:hypothetical protein